ncbi:MAG: histidine phosphatase family protein [Sumerlaeia bacterium]
MILILMRHGIAEDGEPDADRALTQDGRDRASSIVRLLSRFQLAPHLLFSSPRKRALQTAEIIPDLLNQRAEIAITDALDFDGSLRALLSEIRNRRVKVEDPVVIAVGHQPLLGQMAMEALTGDASDLKVHKAACLGIRFPTDDPVPGRGELYCYFGHGLAKGYAEGTKL